MELVMASDQVRVCFLAHDDHTARWMSCDVLAHRSKQHPGEASMSSRSNHQEVRLAGEIDEHLGRVARGDLSLQVTWRVR